MGRYVRVRLIAWVSKGGGSGYAMSDEEAATSRVNSTKYEAFNGVCDKELSNIYCVKPYFILFNRY